MLEPMGLQSDPSTWGASWMSYLIAALTAVVLILGLRALAFRIELVDTPSRRKTHAAPIPLTGGVGMFCGVIFGALTLPQSLGPWRAFFAGAALLVIIGLLDDLEELGSAPRFVAQVAASLLMIYFGGFALHDLGAISPSGNLVALGLWSVPLTVFAAVGVINSTNMVDGLDGLGGGTVLVALAAMGWLCHEAGAIEVLRFISVLAAAIIAFLFFNLRLPGRSHSLAFMGDAGSLFLGFTLAWFVISLSQGEQRLMAPVTALWLLVVPLFDTVWLIIHRAATLRWPTQPGSDHIHHLLLRIGLSPSAVVSILLTIALGMATIGLIAERTGVPEHYMFYGFLALFALYATVMGLAWKNEKLLFWPMDRRLGLLERRAAAERRWSDRRALDDRRLRSDRRDEEGG